MARGLVYIMINPCLDGWVKIGMTERNEIERRLAELNQPTNLPLSYRCYATYEVDDPKEVEKCIHNLIDLVDDSLHARETLGNGRIREREFFKISPEKAYGIFREIATLRNESENLRLYAPTEEQSYEQEIAEAQTRRSNNSFTLLNIPIGTEISFLYDSNITAKVVSSVNEVEYQGQKYSVTALAKKILIENYGWITTAHANGWKYFTINGITLSDLRNKIEAEAEE